MNGTDTEAEATRLARVWQDAQFALLALQLDPQGLGGIWLRAGHGPVREAWLASLQASGLQTVKVPQQVDDERLLGGMDLAQTLQQGRLVVQAGLLAQADGGAVLLPMAERLAPHTAAQIAQAQDQGLVHSRDGQQSAPARFAVIALDESETEEAGLAARLSDRLGLWLDLRGNGLADTLATLEALSPQELREAQAQLRQLQATPAQVQALCEAAWALGVESLRAPLMALRLAVIHAALEGRDTLDEDDLRLAARMVLGPRATRLPEMASAPDTAAATATDSPAQPPSAQTEAPPADATESAQAPEPNAELLVAAALASLPAHLLDRLALGLAPRTPARSSGSSGQALHSKLRGRPLPPRPGQPGSGARLHLLATLRAAVPKQRLRHRPEGSGKVSLRAEDFHVHRFGQASPSCTIFALDASGSAALQRLAEAKGAVELLLQQSYARRDSVCVIAFRAARAEVLLAPTRSLVRAKRALAGLPGGGGTPLASGVQAALVQARALQRAGSTPVLVMLSDGRANVSASGVGGRAQAQADALTWAGQWHSSGFAALWLDTSPQPEPLAQTLAQRMGAQYLPMPYVQAQRMAQAVQHMATQSRTL